MFTMGHSIVTKAAWLLLNTWLKPACLPCKVPVLKPAVCVQRHLLRTEVMQPRGPGENSSGRRTNMPAGWS